MQKISKKSLYKVVLLLLKVLPMLLAALCFIYTIFACFGIELRILSFIGGMSLIPTVFILLTSVVFEFCIYHRLFVYYYITANIINILDYYFKFTINDLKFLAIQLLIAFVFLVLILYFYLREHRNKKVRTTDIK